MVKREEEIKILSKEELKKKYPTKKRLAQRFKPFEGKACLLCDTKFSKKDKVKNDGALIKYIKCSKCGLVHYSNITYPEIMLVSKEKELEHRGEFRYQEEIQLYSKEKPKEESDGNSADENIDAVLEEGVKKAKASKEKSGLMLTNYGSTPIYYGAKE